MVCKEALLPWHFKVEVSICVQYKVQFRPRSLLFGYTLISRIIYLSAYASYLYELQFNPSSASSVYHYQSSSALIQNPSSTSPVTQFTDCDSTSIYTMSRKYATIVPEPPTPTVRIQVSIQAIIIRRKEMGAPKEQPDDPGYGK